MYLNSLNPGEPCALDALPVAAGLHLHLQPLSSCADLAASLFLTYYRLAATKRVTARHAELMRMRAN